MIRLTIPYEPTAKGMPRVKWLNGKAITYFNWHTQKALEDIRTIIASYQLKKFKAHIPIAMIITFYRTKSKWLPKRENTPFRKPDLDNLLKLCLDCVSPLIIPDDAQITTIQASKRWSANGHGYIEIELTEDKL